MHRRDFLTLAASTFAQQPSGAGDWAHYGGDEGASRYSPLARIKSSNIANLKPAWTHAAGDASQRPATTIECTPVAIDGTLYITTPRLQVRALNGRTGEPLWNFDKDNGRRSGRAPGVNRGVMHFADGKDKRIYAALNDKLYCLHAATGELIQSFGDNGIVDLKANFDRDMTDLDFKMNSPAVVYEDTLIVGGGGGEGPRPAGPGHIRGYDVYTGKRKWIFHTIPFPGESGYKTWSKDSWKHNGGTNNWAGMSIDRARGLVFVSTGCSAFDFWGGDRIGDNLFTDCVLAIEARTGKLKWHYQTLHHDVWDYDLPAQPALIRVGKRDAVAQVTKTGFVFLLDRDSGKPLFKVEERPVKASRMEDEVLSKTQPFPVKPKPVSRLDVNEDLLTDISTEAREMALKRFRQLQGGFPFPPPSRQGTIFSPGTLGGALWGGCSFDPERGRIFVNSSELPSIITLVDAKPEEKFRFNHTGYEKFADPEGHPLVRPPWGHVTAIDLASGDFAWRAVHGEYPDLAAKGIRKTGAFQTGGTIATGGGLVFVAATPDEKFSAYSSDSGELVWQHALPAGGYATPCTYEAGGKQYVLIACGGGNRSKTPSGDQFMAFAL